MANFFGWEIKRKKSEAHTSFTSPANDDGALEVHAAGSTYGQYVDLEGTAKNEAELVTRYRKMSRQPEIDYAIEDITNEAIVNNPREPVVKVNVDKIESDIIKNAIIEEFDNIYKLLSLSEHAFDIFKNWYIDGRLYYHAIIDVEKPSNGIVELRHVDPRKIRKIRQTKKEKDPKTGIILTKVLQEFYLYNERGFNSKSTATPDPIGQGVNGVKITTDSVVHVTSGLNDEQNKMILSHLHKAIKPLNQLQVLEDAAVIYRISRAPERRIFYIDVGNLPKIKAEQYLNDMMTKHKNRLVYDAADGSVREDRRFMTTLEDFWLPRREGGRGTEITNLPGGQNLGEMADVEYFQKKLYKSLNVPVSRLESEAGFTIGRASEISRDELKFSKFIDRLRMRFSILFDECLKKQLILKNRIKIEEWNSLKENIRYDFLKDNEFTELKATEIYRERLQTLDSVEPYLGKYFSKAWVFRKVLNLTDEETEQMMSEIQSEQPEEPEESEPNQEPEQNPQEQ